MSDDTTLFIEQDSSELEEKIEYDKFIAKLKNQPKTIHISPINSQEFSRGIDKGFKGYIQGNYREFINPDPIDESIGNEYDDLEEETTADWETLNFQMMHILEEMQDSPVFVEDIDVTEEDIDNFLNSGDYDLDGE